MKKNFRMIFLLRGNISSLKNNPQIYMKFWSNLKNWIEWPQEMLRKLKCPDLKGFFPLKKYLRRRRITYTIICNSTSWLTACLSWVKKQQNKQREHWQSFRRKMLEHSSLIWHRGVFPRSFFPYSSQRKRKKRKCLPETFSKSFSSDYA